MDDALRAVQAVIATIGGKWKLLILFHLVQGQRRYGELRRLIPHITEKMLIQQLRELEVDGMIVRTAYPTIPPRVEYSMSDYARTFCPVMHALCDWGMLHVEQQGKRIPEVV